MSFQEFVYFLCGSLFKNEKILIYCMSLENYVAERIMNHSVSIAKGKFSDLESARKQLEKVPWEFKCDLYDDVQDFFIYKENGKIGHISWLYYMGDPNRILRLGDEEAEVKFCLTLPEHRGKGLYPAALKVIQGYLKDRGYRRCFICVKDDNVSSIRGIEKSGYRLAGSVRVRKVFGVQASRRRDTRHLRGSEVV